MRQVEGKNVRRREDIEAACLEENKCRFYQASGTPFLTEPLYSKVGQDGRRSRLQKKYFPWAHITLDDGDSELDQYTKDLICHLKWPDDLIQLVLF